MIRRIEIVSSAAALVLSLIAVSSSAGCTDAGGPTSPSLVAPGASTDAVASISAEVRGAMDRAIQDEYQAEATYERVVADFGNVPPFVNIVSAEERHSTALARAFQNHGLDVPVSQWSRDNVPRFDTIPASCARAAREEIANIDMYDELLTMELPADVGLVFTNNRRASLENHLPAFQRCAGS